MVVQSWWTNVTRPLEPGHQTDFVPSPHRGSTVHPSSPPKVILALCLLQTDLAEQRPLPARSIHFAMKEPVVVDHQHRQSRSREHRRLQKKKPNLSSNRPRSCCGSAKEAGPLLCCCCCCCRSPPQALQVPQRTSLYPSAKHLRIVMI
jgi:hypothetical protein